MASLCRRCRRSRPVDPSGLLNSVEENGPALNVWQEASSLFAMALPLFVGMVSWAAMKATDTALLGHVDTRSLTASSLSDLWTSSTGVFIQSRVIGTFCGQAYGAGNLQLVGIWLQVSYTVLGSICAFVALAWALTGPVLRACGKSEELSSEAGYYALVLMICLPVRIAFSQLATYFSAQKILRPQVVCAPIGMALNLALGLVFVLGIPIPGWRGFGFKACPWVTTAMEYLQFFLMWYIFCHRLGLHKECWPGWSTSHITRERVWRFLELYVPSALSIAEAFWRVAVIGAIASSLGDVNVGVWNASYRICWIALTFLGSVGGAMGIKLGIAFGRGRAREARFVSAVGVMIASVLLLLIGAVVVCAPRSCGRIFTEDPVVLDLFEESRYPLAAFVMLMNFATTIERILTSAGRTRTVLFAGLIGSWIGQVPCAYACTRFWRKDLVGLYTGVAAGYGLLVVGYTGSILMLDWEQLCEEARQRAEVAPAMSTASPNTLSLQPRCVEPKDKESGDGGES